MNLTPEEIAAYSNGTRHPDGYFIKRLLGKGTAAIVWVTESCELSKIFAAKHFTLNYGDFSSLDREKEFYSVLESF